MPARKGEPKRRLVELARALVADRGFPALTLTTLARAADRTPAQVARTFRDRDALFRAVVDDLRAETFPDPETLPDSPRDPAGCLLAWLDRARKEAAKPNEAFRLLTLALVEVTEADARAELHARLLEWTEPIVRFLKKCQQAGVVRRSLDPQVAAWDLMQAILGHALLGPRDTALTDPSPFDSILQGVMKVDV